MKLSFILGKAIEAYVLSAIAGGRDCRLVVPGLTKSIARQVHDYLKENLAPEIGSYLVIGDDDVDQPSEETGLIRAVGLTSKRIGSFVAIISPGQLIHIQDSIRGSGGAIRSLAFSEEWPWIDNGSEPFRFDGPILNELVKLWSSDQGEQAWLREFTLKGLLKYTKSSSERKDILLENILNSFEPTLYPGIENIREKFLFHSGIPRPKDLISDPNRLIKNLTNLSKKIVDRYQKDDDPRDRVRERINEIISNEEERERIRLSLDRFLDGFRNSSFLDLGLLAFHGCWKNDNDDIANWMRLDADQLADLFEVKPLEKAKVTYDVRCQRGIVSDTRKKIATFFGEIIDIDVNYEILAEDFSRTSWEIRVYYRQHILVKQLLDKHKGLIQIQLNTDDITDNYSRSIPIRIALFSGNEIKAYARLDVHLCGLKRPFFAVVEHTFDIIDATESDTEETPDKKINVHEPVHVFLFSHSPDEVKIQDEEGSDINLIKTEPIGIWRSAKRVDVLERASGQVTWICSFGESSAVICFEATEIDKGEFTLEDELRVMISTGSTEKRLKNLIDLFEGNTREPYATLGKVDKAAGHRIHIAKILTTPTGWQPLLVNLLKSDYDVSGPLGDYFSHLGPVDGEALVNLTLPEEALELIKAYSDAREAVLRQVESNIDMGGTPIEHPVYASFPLYVDKISTKIESLLCNYLEAYKKILSYLHATQKDLEYGQLLVLTYLDCIVHWDKTPLRNAFFFIGPWHPLVLAKRFMVQAALFSRAKRFNEAGGKEFRQLSSLLGQVQGFRWILGLSANNRYVEPAFVSITTDPGWLFAIKISSPALSSEEENKLKQNLGITIETGAFGSHNLAVTVLKNYMRAFPSRRSIGVRVRRGYSASEVVKNVNTFLHDEDGPTIHGMQLPGGVRLYLEEPLEDDVEAKWSDPLFNIYLFEDDEECVRETHPDIYLLPPAIGVSFEQRAEIFMVPRGKGYHSVFSMPLTWLTEGQNLVPTSVSYEFYTQNDVSEGIGGAFIGTLGEIKNVIGKPIETVSSIELHQKLNAPWVIIPGSSIDPAILVKYVRDSVDRKLQERALWDYKMDLTGQANSFFVLSTIPREFQVAVNGFFEMGDTAGRFIIDLGEIGIAIGGEALKSGRHALGVIGLVGAVRLFTGMGGGDGRSPLPRNANKVGFLIPIDPFESFFGKNDSSSGKRTDLLAIHIVLPNSSDEKLRISACGVESKFVSRTLGVVKAHAAMSQGLETIREFKNLVKKSQRDDAIPERLALLELLRFGLRITSPNKPSQIEKWVGIESSIYQAILSGQFEFIDPLYDAVLVSTEGGLPGVAEQVVLEEGLWVRLTKTHWPGVAETPQVDNARLALCNLFEKSSRSGILVPTGKKNLPEKTPPSPDENETTPDKTHDTSFQKQHEKPDDKDLKKPLPLEGILVGIDIDKRQQVYYDPQYPVDPLDNLNIMVTGSSGKGKTQFLKYLICKIREQEKKILVLDFKKDFANDRTFCEIAKLERVFVDFDGLPFNPLIPYPVRHYETGELYMQIAQHITGISSILAQTFKLGPQQQVDVKNAIVSAFTTTGVPTAGMIPYKPNLQFPDFSDVGDILQHDNQLAYNRLDPLFTLDLFRADFRGHSFDTLVNRSVALDLSGIHSEPIKNSLAQLVVLSAHSYYNAQPQPGYIRQFLVFDEAHRVLVSDFILRLVRECRAYGVGTILSSQYPSDFPSEISASMATKVIHGNDHDADRVKAIVKLLGCDGREGDIASLERFQAFLDNRRYPSTLIRTMNYPLYIVWSKVQELGTTSYEDLSKAKGIEISKLPIRNLIQQLVSMGLVEEKEGQVTAIKHNRPGTV